MQEPLEGAQLREMRRAAGMTQREVGDRLGVTASAVGQWETGATRPSWKQAQGLAEIFADATPSVDLADRVARLEAVVRQILEEMARSDSANAEELGRLADRLEAGRQGHRTAD